MPDDTTVALDPPIVGSRPAMTLAGIRRHHRFEGVDLSEFPRQISEMQARLPGLAGRVGDRVYGVFWAIFDVPDDVDGFDHLVGVEMAEGAAPPDGLDTLALPAQTYVAIANREGDDPRGTGYTLWHEWLPTTDHTPAPAQPQFLYRRGEEEQDPLDVLVPVAP